MSLKLILAYFLCCFPCAYHYLSSNSLNSISTGQLSVSRSPSGHLWVPALAPEMLVTTALWVSLRGPLGGPWVLCVQANFPDPTSSSFLADALLREVLPPAAPWREAHRKCIPWRNGTPEMCTWLSHITDNLADSELHVGNLLSWIAREIWHTVFQRPLCCYKDKSNPISWSFLLM